MWKTFIDEEFEPICRKLFELISLKDREIGELEYEISVRQEEYDTLRTPEIVRSAIDDYEHVWFKEDGFEEDKSKTKDLTGRPLSEEKRRQKWLHILLNSSLSSVNYLRKLILLNGLEDEYFHSFKSENFESVKKLTEYDEYVKLNQEMISHLELIKTDDFIVALLNYLKNPKVKPANLAFGEWYVDQFDNFARYVSEIYSLIENIDEGKFDRHGHVPIECILLKQTDYKTRMNYLLSCYDDYEDE